MSSRPRGWRALLGGWSRDRLFSKVLRNSTYLFASYALGAVLTILTAKLLGAASFGVLGTVTVFSSNINRLFSFRMGEMVVKYMGDALAHNNPRRAAAAVKTAVLVEAVTSLLAFGALALLAPVGAIYFAKDPNTAPLFVLYGISILANLVYETSIGVLQVTNHYRSQALINFIQTVLVAILLGLAAVYQAGLETVLWIYLIGKIILGLGPAFVALYWLPRAVGPGWWRVPLSEMPSWREVIHFSFSTNFSSTINMVARDSEVPIVSFFFGPTAAGYFKMALALINLVVMPITPFISTTYPEFTRSYANRAWNRLRSLLQRVTLVSAGWTLLVTLALVLGRDILFAPFTLFGRTFNLLSEYAPAYPALMLLLIGYGVANIFFWNRPLLLAQGLADYPLKVAFWGMVIKVVLMLTLLPRTNYLVEAALLSAYLAGTVALIVWRGLREIRKAEQQTLRGDLLESSLG